MKFTQIPADLAATLAVNAGVLATAFVPSTGTLDSEDIIGATTGGVSATCVPSYTDFGEDVDNCPKNTKEMKQIKSWECKMSGTFVTADTAAAKMLLGAADIDSVDTTKVTPRATIESADFNDIWYICDYSNYNGATNGGFVAIKLIDALSSGGFSLQSTDKEKGQFAFEFIGHTSIDDPDTIPMEFYIQAGTAEPA